MRGSARLQLCCLLPCLLVSLRRSLLMCAGTGLCHGGGWCAIRALRRGGRDGARRRTRRSARRRRAQRHRLLLPLLDDQVDRKRRVGAVLLLSASGARERVKCRLASCVQGPRAQAGRAVPARDFVACQTSICGVSPKHMCGRGGARTARRLCRTCLITSRRMVASSRRTLPAKITCKRGGIKAKGALCFGLRGWREVFAVSWLVGAAPKPPNSPCAPSATRAPGCQGTAAQGAA